MSNLDQLLKSNFKLAKKTKPDKVLLDSHCGFPLCRERGRMGTDGPVWVGGASPSYGEAMVTLRALLDVSVHLQVFLEAYNCIEGHAALKPHTAKIKELFTRALEHFPEAPVADAAAPAEQEPAMSVRQWRLFCEWQDVVGDDDRRLSMNTVMLAFVQVRATPQCSPRTPNQPPDECVCARCVCVCVYVQVYARRLGQSTFDEEAMDLPSALAVAKGDVKKPPRAQPRLTLHAFEDAVATLAWAHARQLGAVKGLPLSEKFNAFAALLSAHKPLPR